jgi:biotin operon repressor
MIGGPFSQGRAAFFAPFFGKYGLGKGANMRETQLADYLRDACSGRANTRTANQIQRALHLSGTDLRKLVHRLRRQGVPIASSRDGYFYAVTAGEVYDTIRQLQGMERGLTAAINGLERALERFENTEKGEKTP